MLQILHPPKFRVSRAKNVKFFKLNAWANVCSLFCYSHGEITISLCAEMRCRLITKILLTTIIDKELRKLKHVP